MGKFVLMLQHIRVTSISEYLWHRILEELETNVVEDENTERFEILQRLKDDDDEEENWN